MLLNNNVNPNDQRSEMILPIDMPFTYFGLHVLQNDGIISYELKKCCKKFKKGKRCKKCPEN